MKDIIITIEMSIDETQHSNGEVANGISNDLSTIGWNIDSVVVRDKHRHHIPPRDVTGGKEGIGL